MTEQHVSKQFFKYVSQNILGMIGMSAYILADTFFISKAEGANGITALNLVLPLYSLIFAIGSMLGVGSATRFRISRARKSADADTFFSNAIVFAVIISVIFVLLGISIPDKIIGFMGGDHVIIKVGTPYARIFLLFAPFFMVNYIINAFVRNDGAPTLAMVATLCSNLFNIIMDYVLMFPLGMGMAGAALATAASPIVGILICCIYLFSKKSTIKISHNRPSIKRFLQSCQLGISAFVGEISSGVTTLVFNTLILRLAGNVGVAAYGVIANVAIVATSIFNGISQGTQPLFSSFYGKQNIKAVNKVLKLSIVTALVFGILILIVAFTLAAPIVKIFNSEKNVEMAAYAIKGVRLYFPGYIFAGFNIVGTGYLSATEKAGYAFGTSILRGFIAITACAFILATLFEMTGVWLAFSVAEAITTVVMIFVIRKMMKK